MLRVYLFFFITLYIFPLTIMCFRENNLWLLQVLYGILGYVLYIQWITFTSLLTVFGIIAHFFEATL